MKKKKLIDDVISVSKQETVCGFERPISSKDDPFWYMKIFDDRRSLTESPKSKLEESIHNKLN